MRVVMVMLEYLPIMGGAQRQLAAVAPRLQRAGIDVHVITRRATGLPFEEMIEGVRVHRLWAPGPKAVASVLFTISALRRLRELCPDLVHAYSLFSPATIAVLARRLRGVPVVAKVLRGGRAGDIERLLRKPLARGRIAALRGGIDRFISISSEIEHELHGLGVERAGIVTIPNGVDVERFREASPGERDALRRVFELPAGPVAIYSGRLVTEKRVDLLVSAWRSVRKRYADATLLVVGTGACGPELRRSAGEGVRFVGEVDDVARLLRAADVFVLPSSTEGLSNALLEAMATGLSVLVTRVGGAVDVIEDGCSGRLIPAGDEAALRESLLELLDSSRAELRAALGRGARAAMVDRYSLESVAARLVCLYDEVLQGSHPPVVASTTLSRTEGEEAVRR